MYFHEGRNTWAICSSFESLGTYPAIRFISGSKPYFFQRHKRLPAVALFYQEKMVFLKQILLSGLGAFVDKDIFVKNRLIFLLQFQNKVLLFAYDSNNSFGPSA
jgi:hypothetical protein